MAEAPVVASIGTPKAKKGKATGGTEKAKTAPSHPQMVNAAIKARKEGRGSSTQAIKKYISSTYMIEAEKKSQFIRKYLKSAVASVDYGSLPAEGVSRTRKRKPAL